MTSFVWSSFHTLVAHGYNVAQKITTNSLVQKVSRPVVQLWQNDSMCQSAQPLPVTGLFTKRNSVKLIGLIFGSYIVWRALKSTASEINRRYIRATVWHQIYERSKHHPEVFVLVELFTFAVPFVFFHFLFRSAWSLIRAHHRHLMHGHPLSKRRHLLRVAGVIGFFTFTWFAGLDSQTLQRRIKGRDLSVHSWATEMTLLSIDHEEVRWHRRVGRILDQHFENINGLSSVVLQFVQDSQVFELWQHMLLRQQSRNDREYRRERAQSIGRKYTSRLREYKCFGNALLLSVQSTAYMILIWKAIKCQTQRGLDYYEKLDAWHNRFDVEAKFEVYPKKPSRVLVGMKVFIGTVWNYLFVGRRVPLSQFVVPVVERSVNYFFSWYHMDTQTRRKIHNGAFRTAVVGAWWYFYYLIVESLLSDLR